MLVSHGIEKIMQPSLKHRILSEHNMFDDILYLITLDFFHYVTSTEFHLLLIYN